MSDVYSCYFQVQGNNDKSPKAPIPGHCGWQYGKGCVDLQTAKARYSSYAGLLRNDVVCIDVDTKQDNPQKGLATYNLINNYVKSHKIKCRIMKTTHGWHFYFKLPESEKSISKHTPAILCCGVEADYLVSPSYCVIKLDGKSRQLLQNPPELDELPVPFRLAIASDIQKYQFFNAGHGERHKAICGFKLVLMKKGLNQEQITECINMACSLFSEKYTQSKINEICRIQDSEIEKIKTSQSDDEKELKRKDKEAKLTDLEGSELADRIVEEHSVIAIDNDFDNLYYKENKDDIYTPISFCGKKSRLENLCKQYTSKTITKNVYETIRKEIQAKMATGYLEKFNHYISTSNGEIMDVETLTIVENKDAIIRVKLNCKYNPNAYSKTVDDAIDNFCNHDKILRMEFEEVMGQCILPTNEVKALTIIQGEPNSGKTTMINMFKNAIGEWNASTLNLEDIIKETFFAYKLDGKTANFGDEITGTDKLSIERLKALTGDSVITVNKKNVNPFDMRNGATLVFMCNQFPTFKTIDYALEDRLHMIHIPNNNFPKNPNFLKEVSTEEAKSYLLNIMIEGIKRVRNNGYQFTKSLNSIQTKNKYIGKSDILKGFLGNLYSSYKIDIYDDKTYSTLSLYDKFIEYWTETYGTKYEVWPRKVFTEKVKRELCCESKQCRDENNNEIRYYFFIRSKNSKELKEFEIYSDKNLDKSIEELEIENSQINLVQSIEVFTKNYVKAHPQLNVLTSNVFKLYHGIEKSTLEEFERDFSFYARCIVIGEPHVFTWKREDYSSENNDNNQSSNNNLSSDNQEEKSAPLVSNGNILIFYDFEVFKYDWMVTFKILKPGKIFRDLTIINNRTQLEDFYNEYKEKSVWIGYNSNNYDVYIFKAIIKGYDPYEVSQVIIKHEEKVYKKYKFNDVLTDMKSYDCVVKNGGFAVGLKELEAYMGDSIEESGVDFNIDRKLTPEELQEVKKYNIHDVEETVKVFMNNLNTFRANTDIIRTFNLPPTDLKKTQAQLSAKVLKCRKPLQDRGDELNIEILPTIKIDKNKDVIDWYLNIGWLKDTKQLVKSINGVPHTFGIGGLHGAIEKPIHEKGNILHIDVNSYYPSLAIRYNLLTRNSQAPEVYKQIYDKRIELKKAGKKEEQAPYKIILNATYGITKDKYSDAYDPRQGNMICINGQLALLDLIEKLENKCELLQSNTDGLIVKYGDNEDEIKTICKEWEDRLGITLGYDYIDEIWQKDANNYMIKYKNDKVECKGIDLAETTVNKNNCGIIGRAVREYLLKGTPIEETISNKDNDLIEYQMIAKAGGTYDGGLYYGAQKLDTKYNRVFASKNEKDPTIYKLKINKRKNDEGKFEEIKTQMNEPPLGSEKVANLSEHVFIDNGDIKGKKLDNRIDLNFYIKQAKTILRRFK